MIFHDDCATWNETPIWVNWIYDNHRQLLMICPKIPPNTHPLWLKILKSVDVPEWLSFFQGQSTELTGHPMIFHSQSIQKLISQLSPKNVWVMEEFNDKNLQEKVILSPPPNQWSQPGIKKHLWLNWLKILQN